MSWKQIRSQLKRVKLNESGDRKSTYIYADGFNVVREDYTDGSSKKIYRDPKGGPRSNTPLWPIQSLPDDVEYVYIVEGEKDCLALNLHFDKMGSEKSMALTYRGGSSAAQYADYSAISHVPNVYLLGDDDVAGVDAQQKIKECLKAHKDQTVFVVELDGFGSGQGAFDWIQDNTYDTRVSNGSIAEYITVADVWKTHATVLTGDPPPKEEPAFVADNGSTILYLKHANTLYGAPGKGKSFVSLIMAHQMVQAEKKVLYLDFENSAASQRRRMDSLGITRELVESGRFWHIQADKLLASETDMKDYYESFGAEMDHVIFDAMAGSNVYTEKEEDYRAWFNQYVSTLLLGQDCGITILDNTPKVRKDSYGPIGHQAKLALPGAGIKLEGHGWMAGSRGEMSLYCDKDRFGDIYRSPETMFVAKVTLEPKEGDQYTWTIGSPKVEADQRVNAAQDRHMKRVESMCAVVSNMSEEGKFPCSKNIIANRSGIGRGLSLKLLAELEEVEIIKVTNTGTWTINLAHVNKTADQLVSVYETNRGLDPF